MVSAARALGAEKLVVWDFKDERKPDQLRSIMDVLIKKKNISAAIVAARIEGKPFAIVGVRQDVAARGLKAGDVARELGARAGGSGGGKDHLAQFGMSDDAQVAGAFAEFERRAAAHLGA